MSSWLLCLFWICVFSMGCSKYGGGGGFEDLPPFCIILCFKALITFLKGGCADRESLLAKLCGTNAGAATGDLQPQGHGSCFGLGGLKIIFNTDVTCDERRFHRIFSKNTFPCKRCYSAAKNACQGPL